MIFCAAVFDIGTSSLKGALIAEDGKVYTQGRLFFPQNLEAETSTDNAIFTMIYASTSWTIHSFFFKQKTAYEILP